jgi:hypothetical protein
MEGPSPTTYVVKQEADRLVFIPSPTLVGLMVGGFGAGSAFLVYLSTIFFRRTGATLGDLLPGVIFLLVAGFSAYLGIRAWSTRHTPLNIEFGGRVSYGERELCGTGAVRAVRITPLRVGEAGDCEVFLELDGGKLLSIPSQYFGAFKSRKHARPFAKKLAEALGVQVSESR